MKSGDCIRLCRIDALEKEWPWLEPVRATRKVRWWSGKVYWVVESNSGSRGCAARFEVDDSTRTITKRFFLPR